MQLNKAISHLERFVKILRNLILLLTLILAISLHAGAEQGKPFCEDWGELNTLLKQRPNDLDIQALHALKTRLCEKVWDGKMTEERASKIYEHRWKAIIKQMSVVSS